MIDNLLSNALKHTARGGCVGVVLTTETDRVEVAVSDTGTGIPAVDRDRLFDRFHRSSTSRALAIPGVGLGLSIARDIVAAHGGRIELESEVGRGTTVRVRLPLDREGAGPAPVGP